MAESTVYEKLQAVRAELAKTAIQKSGNNEYSGYSYYELDDFIKPVTQLLNDHKLCTAFDFTNHFAVLKVINSEKPGEFITFHSPMAKAEVKGCQAIQNLGAVETYERRYLYLMAFDISESDGLEPATGSPQPGKAADDKAPDKKFQQKSGCLSQEQCKTMYSAIKNKFGNNAKSMIKTLTNHEKLGDIPAKQFDTFMKVIEEYQP